MKVTIGRIVRFVDDQNKEWPAIVTAVHSDEAVMGIDLQVFRRMDIIPATSVHFHDPSTGTRGYSWHWPERA
jgi:hypothetical protein